MKRLRKIVAWAVLMLTGVFFLLAAGVKFGWGTPLLVLIAIGFSWALHEVLHD